jgi:DNA mismatch endonuclease (patch repair protein)
MPTSEDEAGNGHKRRPCMNRHPTNLEPSGFGGLSRADLMSRVRSRGNRTTEGRMVALLRHHGLTGWRRHARVPGRPDFAWPKRRVAVFVDGCFWHGHQCGRNLTPKKNAELWEKKFAATRRRDARNGRILRQRGWTVIRIWECKLGRSPDSCVKRIRAALEST